MNTPEASERSFEDEGRLQLVAYVDDALNPDWSEGKDWLFAGESAAVFSISAPVREDDPEVLLTGADIKRVSSRPFVVIIERGGDWRTMTLLSTDDEPFAIQGRQRHTYNNVHAVSISATETEIRGKASGKDGLPLDWRPDMNELSVRWPDLFGRAIRRKLGPSAATAQQHRWLLGS